MGRVLEKYGFLSLGLALLLLFAISACQSIHDATPHVAQDVRLLSYPALHSPLGMQSGDIEKMLGMKPYLQKKSTTSYGPFDNGLHVPFFLQIKTNADGEIVVARVTATTQGVNSVSAVIQKGWCSALLPGDAHVTKQRFYDTSRNYWITVYHSDFLQQVLPLTKGDVQMVESLVAQTLSDCIVATRGENSIS